MSDPEEDNNESRKRRRYNNDSSDSSDSDDSCEERKRKKRKKKHKGKKKSRKKYDSSSSGDDSSSDRRRHKREKKKKKKRGKDHDRKKRSPSPPSFGKYGIVKASDMQKKQRSFDAWMAEVKGIPSFTGAKWELQNYFKEYAEDFNTSTLPHQKFYDYDKWEMEEYQREKEEENKRLKSSNSMLADETRHQAAMRERTERKRQEELELLRATMNSGKIADMKRQKGLQAELAHAFKTGDQERVQKIKQKLEPEAR